MKYSSGFDKSLSLYNYQICPTELLMAFMEVEGKYITRVEWIALSYVAMSGNECEHL